jgi:hypothetical protein
MKYFEAMGERRWGNKRGRQFPGWRRRGGFAAALEIMSHRSVELSPESRTIVLGLGVVVIHAVTFGYIHISIELPLTRHCSFSLETIVGALAAAATRPNPHVTRNLLSVRSTVRLEMKHWISWASSRSVAESPGEPHPLTVKICQQFAMRTRFTLSASLGLSRKRISQIAVKRLVSIIKPRSIGATCASDA